MNANIEGAIEKKQEEQKELFDNILGADTMRMALDALSNFSPDGEGGDEVIAAMFAMSDKQFETLAPVFLSEVQKAYNDTNVQLTLANSMNTQGVKYEDIIESYNEIVKALAEISDDDISPIKKSFLAELFGIILNSIAETQMVSKRIIEIPIEHIKAAKIPTYANVGDAAIDLCSLGEYDIAPGETLKIPTGLKMAIPEGYALLIQPRSGMSLKTKLRICNTPGLIDSGYRGEICVLVENIEAPIKDVSWDEELGLVPLYGESYHIGFGERFAQARLVEVPKISFLEVSKIPEDTERGEGGFGSTGLK